MLINEKHLVETCPNAHHCGIGDGGFDDGGVIIKSADISSLLVSWCACDW